MSRFRVCILTALLLCVGSAQAQVTVKKIDYKGWKDCFEVSNPLVRVVVVPQIGGRIMEYSIAGQNVIWQNQSELGKISGSDIGKVWRNYGGHKAWNAPQSQWHATDQDYMYDSLPAHVEPLPDQAGVRITTSPIEHLGYQFVRDVVLTDRTSRVRITERMRNISDRDIAWSVWGVTQVNVPCWIVFPLAEKSKLAAGWNVICPASRILKQLTRVGNIGFMRYANLTENWATDARAGWMAYLDDRLAFTKHWSMPLVGVTYPDKGCDAAFFTCTKDYFGGYAEMEEMGPIVKLKPGEETQVIEDWFLTPIDKPAKDIPEVMAELRVLQARGMLPPTIK